MNYGYYRFKEDKVKNWDSYINVRQNVKDDNLIFSDRYGSGNQLLYLFNLLREGDKLYVDDILDLEDDLVIIAKILMVIKDKKVRLFEGDEESDINEEIITILLLALEA